MAGSLKARINGELLVVGRPGPPGNPGANGTDGVDGVDGADGVGVPAGGADGQVLAKGSAADYDTEWINPPAGGGGGGITLLATASLTDAIGTTVATSSTTPSDVHASLTVTFTVPTSGTVWIRLSALAGAAGTGNLHVWMLREGTTTVTGTERAVVDTNGSRTAPQYYVPITGLTPGASKTYKWGFRSAISNASTIYYGTGTANPFGAAIMEVWG